MFRSIGFILVLLVLSKLLSGAFEAFENATVAVFETVEVAATVSQSQMKDLQSQ